MFKVGDRVKPKARVWREHEKAKIVEIMIHPGGRNTNRLLFDGEEKPDALNWYFSMSLVSLNGIELMLETFEE